ncbi:hypothetical protein Tco_0759230, partial [Tanacetum coccineum]
SIPPGIDDVNFDPEEDLLLLDKLLNDDPSSPLLPKELHVKELKIVKSSIDDPSKLELNDLPSHLEYTFLEGTDKLPVIIAKNDFENLIEDLSSIFRVSALKRLKDFKMILSVTTAQLQLLEGLILSEMRSKTYQRRDKG